jgi:hypothetical protein
MRQLSLHGNPDDIEAHMTEKPTEAYLAGYFFGRDGRRTERRFDDLGIEIKAYGEGFVDGRRTARGAEDWRKAIEHERSLGLPWHDRLNIQIRKSWTPARPATLIEPAPRRAAEGSGTASRRGA